MALLNSSTTNLLDFYSSAPGLGHASRLGGRRIAVLERGFRGCEICELDDGLVLTGDVQIGLNTVTVQPWIFVGQ